MEVRLPGMNATGQYLTAGEIKVTPKTQKHHSAPTDKIEVFYIAIQMHKAGIPENFIVEAVRIAQELDGAADLMHLWSKEGGQNEKDAIITDIQDLIDASNQS